MADAKMHRPFLFNVGYNDGNERRGEYKETTMVDISHLPKGRTAIRELTEEDFDGFDLKDIKCRSCSGYGNCGFKSYGLYQGKAVSICNQRKYQLQCERDGKPFDPSDLFKH